MDKTAILRSVNFGQRVAENEAENLKRYFVKTDQWRKAIDGEVDIIYGPKGSGKSAIYSLLLENAGELLERSIIFVTAENPRGATAFKDIITHPPTTENEFQILWKLYLLTLIVDACENHGVKNGDLQSVTKQLVEAGLLVPRSSLAEKFSSAVRYVRKFFNPESAETTTLFDPITGVPIGISGKITFAPPTQEQARIGIQSLDTLLELTASALDELQLHVWLGVDRLDVSFADNEDLEANALRALFKVYLDFQGYSTIHLKIFLRTDIWRRITTGGFREASHITKALTLTWGKNQLLNLIMRRLTQSQPLVDAYAIDCDSVLGDIAQQESLFYRVFPGQVDVGSRKPTTLDWMLSRTADGTGSTAPRELIHLLNTVTERELERLNIGGDPPIEENLYSRAVIKESLLPVSQVRLEQTLYAEYPRLKERVERLEGEKATQCISTLSRIWETDESRTWDIAEELVEVGFFEKKGSREAPDFWVPFLYREALDLVWGKAD